MSHTNLDAENAVERPVEYGPEELQALLRISVAWTAERGQTHKRGGSVKRSADYGGNHYCSITELTV